MVGAWWVLVPASVALGARRSRQAGGFQDDMMNIKMLGISVPGTPGEDYPIFSSVPRTSFTCSDKVEGGYYADMETGCQVHHTCGAREDFNLIRFSTLCPNGTIFDQEGQTCRWWYLVDCQASDSFYFSQTNIRESQQSSVNTQQSSSSDSLTSGNFDSASQFGVSQPRPSEDDSIRTVFIPVPESLLNSLNVNFLASTNRDQQSNTQSRRVEQTNSEARRRQTNSDSQRAQSNNRNRNSQRNRNQQNKAQPTRNRTPDRRTQQTRNELTNSVDNNRSDRRSQNGGPATLPPTQRDFSFANGKLDFRSG